MHDLRWLRENPDAFDQGMKRRGLSPMAAEILELDKEKRGVETKVQEEQSDRNRLSREIGQRRGPDGKPPQDLIDQVAALKDSLKAGEARLKELEEELTARLSALPNLLADDVPDGASDVDNREERRWGEPRSFAFEPREHDEIGPALGMDLERAAKMSGSRFVVLKGQLARLERAIAQFMLDVQTGEHGYTEISPPLLVRDQAVYGTNQLPKFAEDLFRTTDGRWLIPTAEVVLTNLVAGEIIDAAELPYRFTASTHCFRSEAGAAGKDTRGMIRQHQFQKVELVSITVPEQSEDEHARMTGCAEVILQRLGLPYRVMTLCSGDTGFGARKTHDLEVWLPGQDAYREISSCSNCGDFQARRMNARCRTKGEKSTRFVHTLNGSGLAVGRTLVAVIENYQEADGSVTIPEALRAYTGGMERLVPNG
ncbi:MAG: serine--tRNA ligase [Geminicoccaceae bacterium]|nr:serine--tRNA ligase [Geminicoccaceae bacterium]MCB9943122.1 serine--tRNA ligase [Geminicoccaceae bacterium]